MLFFKPFPFNHHVFITKFGDDEPGIFYVFFILHESYQLALFKYFIARVKFCVGRPFDIVFFNKNYSRPFFQPWEYSIEQYSNHPLDEYNIDIIPEKDIYNYLNYSRDKNIRGFFSIYSKSKLIDVHPEYVEIENQPSNSYSFDLNFTK